MIEQIRQGTSHATINYTKDGVTVHFNKTATPKFIAQVGAMVDEFIWNKEENTQPRITDTFERQKDE